MPANNFPGISIRCRAPVFYFNSKMICDRRSVHHELALQLNCSLLSRNNLRDAWNPRLAVKQKEVPTSVGTSLFVPATGAEHVILQRDGRKCEDWSGQHPALFKRYLGRLPKNLKPGATLHGANLRRAGAIDRLPLC
jgi:hypothetical protein